MDERTDGRIGRAGRMQIRAADRKNKDEIGLLRPAGCERWTKLIIANGDQLNGSLGRPFVNSSDRRAYSNGSLMLRRSGAPLAAGWLVARARSPRLGSARLHIARVALERREQNLRPHQQQANCEHPSAAAAASRFGSRPATISISQPADLLILNLCPATAAARQRRAPPSDVALSNV